MVDSLTEFLTWAVRDVIFFSGDVQTTTIAVAITSSLCCSIVLAVVHVIMLIRPPDEPRQPARRKYLLTSHRKRFWLGCEKVQVPCVKCGQFYADDGCRFVTCRHCCFSVQVCHVHVQGSLCSQACQPRLTHLDFSCGGLQSCPDRLGFVGAQLSCLNLNENELQSVPAEIGLLKGLQVLSLERNSLATLPDALCSLTQLQCLDVSHNCLETVPACVWSMLELQQLHLCHNAISSLPAEISKLQHLLMLDVSHNKFEELCGGLVKLFLLKYLYVSGNCLRSLPESVGHLVSLERLDVSYCGLTHLPQSLAHCSKLQALTADGNRLRMVPDSLGLLKNLVALEVTDNQLPYLPYTLKSSQDKLVLKVKGNPLLKEADFPQFSCTKPGNSVIGLQELSAREIIRRHIPFSGILPKLLQGLLQSAGRCCQCEGPVCAEFASHIVPVHFSLCDTCVPLLRRTCHTHPPHTDHG